MMQIVARIPYVRCPKCGERAAPEDEECPACGWVFAATDPIAITAPELHRSPWRMVVGVIGLLLILGAGVERCTTASLNNTASAVQITQIYTEGAFFVLVVVGAVVAFYVAVRPD